MVLILFFIIIFNVFIPYNISIDLHIFLYINFHSDLHKLLFLTFNIDLHNFYFQSLISLILFNFEIIYIYFILNDIIIIIIIIDLHNIEVFDLHILKDNLNITLNYLLYIIYIILKLLIYYIITSRLCRSALEL